MFFLHRISWGFHGRARPCAAAFRRRGLRGTAPAPSRAARLGRGEAKGGIPLDAGAARCRKEIWEDREGLSFDLFLEYFEGIFSFWVKAWFLPGVPKAGDMLCSQQFLSGLFFAQRPLLFCNHTSGSESDSQGLVSIRGVLQLVRFFVDCYSHSTKTPSSSVFDGSLAWNGGPETSRATLSPPCACRIAFVVPLCQLWDRACNPLVTLARMGASGCSFVLRCKFRDRSRSTLVTLGLSDRSLRGLVRMLRSLAQLFSRHFGCQIGVAVVRCSLWSSKRCCVEEVFYRDLTRRAFTESVYRNFTRKFCKHTFRSD